MGTDLLIRRIIIVIIAPLIPMTLAMGFIYVLLLSRSVALAWHSVRSELDAICANWRS